jgi:hypothetical protein
MEDNSREQSVQSKKITVGFKCDPSLKAKLSKEAQKLGISLSELSESIISNHYDLHKTDHVEAKPDSSEQPKKTCFDNLESRLTSLLEEEVSPLLISIEEIKELLLGQGAMPIEGGIDEKIKILSEENENLKFQLAKIADNQELTELFEKYNGKSLEYQTKAGQVKKIKVSSYSDVITALIETIIDKQ